MSALRIPDDRSFVENLVLQRTGPFIACGGGGALNHWFATGDKAPLFDFLAGNGLLGRFLRDVHDEVAREVDALIASLPPTRLCNVVSIGPGNGMLELLLMRRTGIDRMLLVDIEHSDTHRHGYGETGSGYASLAATRSFLASNGIAAASILTCNPRAQRLPDFEFDLLISMLSMGFHYPCDEYVDFIEGNAVGGSVVALDKRRGAPDAGYDRLVQRFRVARSIAADKHDRVLLVA